MRVNGFFVPDFSFVRAVIIAMLMLEVLGFSFMLLMAALNFSFISVRACAFPVETNY